jgi:uncharacterized damage-inducible protein DinB
MTSREQFAETLKDEIPRFERALRAAPEARLDYRPHEKSRSAGELLSVFVEESGMFTAFLETGEVDFAKLAPVKHTRVVDFVEALTRGLKATETRVRSMSEADWDRSARMLVDGKVEWETTRGQMAWSLLLDLIHHRGQLSVYLRPMGGSVPAIYGPSADAKS